MRLRCVLFKKSGPLSLDREADACLKVSERQIRNFIASKLLRKSKAQAKTLIPGEDERNCGSSGSSCAGRAETSPLRPQQLSRVARPA